MALIVALTALILLTAVLPTGEEREPAGPSTAITNRLDLFLLDDPTAADRGPTVAAAQAIAGTTGADQTVDGPDRPRGGPAGSSHRFVH